MPVTTVHSTHSSLIPGTTYHYMFGDSGPGGSWSPEFSFTAPPPVGPNSTTRVVAFGGEGYPCAVCISCLEIVGNWIFVRAWKDTLGITKQMP